MPQAQAQESSTLATFRCMVVEDYDPFQSFEIISGRVPLAGELIESNGRGYEIINIVHTSESGPYLLVKNLTESAGSVLLEARGGLRALLMKHCGATFLSRLEAGQIDSLHSLLTQLVELTSPLAESSIGGQDRFSDLSMRALEENDMRIRGVAATTEKLLVRHQRKQTTDVLRALLEATAVVIDGCGQGITGTHLNHTWEGIAGWCP